MQYHGSKCTCLQLHKSIQKASLLQKLACSTMLATAMKTVGSPVEQQQALNHFQETLATFQ